MTTPNIVPCIAIEIPPLALDLLIDAMMERNIDDLNEEDVEMHLTLSKLLRAYREDYLLKTT